MDSKKFFSERYAQVLSGDPVLIRGLDAVSNDILTGVREMLAGIKARKILDYGCGVGKFVRFLVNNFDATEYLGVDIVAAVVNSNKEYFSNQEVKFRTLRGSLTGKFDLIWTASTLQHMDDDEVASILEKFRTALKASGHLVVWVNTSDLPDLAYMRRRSAESYLDMLANAGFKACIAKRDFPVGSEKITVMVVK